jgi:hypothetical protein
LTIKSSANSSQINLAAENRLILWDQSAGWLYTQEHQRLIDATDNFFDQVNSLATKAVVWGYQNVPTMPAYSYPGTRGFAYGAAYYRANGLGR